MSDLNVVPDDEDYTPPGYEQPDVDDPGDLPGHGHPLEEEQDVQDEEGDGGE